MTHQVQAYIKNRGGVCDYFVTRPYEKEDNKIDCSKIPKETEVILVLGGDGTLIRTARDVVSLRIPLIGVNLGTLGYLCELTRDTVFAAIDQIFEDHYELENRIMLRGVDEQGNVKGCALNDVVIHRMGLLQIVRINVYISDKYLTTYNADGIIVSTPTGSTGYSMSSGGPIVDPKADLLLITPISPHALSSKSIVISPEDTICLEIAERRAEQDEEVVVSFDGDQLMSLNVGEKITISKSPLMVKILKIGSQSFLEILQKKMSVYNDSNDKV
ncbi:NAD+ kinase [Eubacterium oxidoreducens]|uniref:NAD kinase n=2 Tax=Eubacterium oxidoreducens TaxID=1732 RepID=A0A1G6AKQ7_EUBOX|nr:NAD+ kinase [Eubacterium oxidoreducens]